MTLLVLPRCRISEAKSDLPSANSPAPTSGGHEVRHSICDMEFRHMGLS